jgi:ADP-heptose:LPS heptosyltransferase
VECKKRGIKENKDMGEFAVSASYIGTDSSPSHITQCVG